MKKVLMFLLVVSACFGGYKESYDQATEFYNNGNFVDAEIKYTEAIEFEENCYVFMGRGKSRFYLGKFQPCIDDCLVVAGMHAENRNLVPDYIFSEAVRFRIYSLVLMKGGNKSITKNKPSYTINDDYIFISGNEEYKEHSKSLASFCVIMGLCDSIDDVQYFDNGDMIIPKKCHCGCKNNNLLNDNRIKSRHDNTPENQCKSNCCVLYALCTGAIWVAEKAGKLPHGLGTCLGFFIDALEEKCEECCEGGNFHQNCIVPAIEFIEKFHQDLIEWLDNGGKPINIQDYS